MTRSVRKLAASLAALAAAIAPGGCALPLLPQGDSKEAQRSLEKLTEEDPDAAGSNTPLISRYAFPYGLNYVKVEAVALATGLHGTGEDPPATPQRAVLLDEMARQNTDKPQEVLASPDTALVLLRAFLPPGVQKGDRFDVEVRTPTRSQTTSLRYGWVLPARMTELAVLDQQIRQGTVLATAEGPVLVDPSSPGKGDEAVATSGHILGGGVALKSRSLGLVIAQDHRSVRLAQSIAKSVNDRFSQYERGRKTGVAEAKTDEFVRLQVHERYKDNIERYVRVVRNIALRESPSATIERMTLLEKQLVDPLTAATAALRLEAIGGDEAAERLRVGLASEDPEVRFYAAEALAYLDRTECVQALAAAAREIPAFRAHSLAALSAMDDVVAYDALRELLASSSAETRYGAFRALWAMNESDPLVHGERLGGQFGYHVLDVDGPPMIHVTRSDRPEIVVFGVGQRFELPLVLDAGRDILVNGLAGDEVVVSRFGAGKATEKRTVSPDVDEVIRAIVELGGAYPDVVEALQQAKSDGALASRFSVDALPSWRRAYDRENLREDSAPDGAAAEDTAAEVAAEEEGIAEDEDVEEIVDEEPAGPAYRVTTPVPDLFNREKK